MASSSPASQEAGPPGNHTVETREILVDGRYVTDGKLGQVAMVV